jgi:bacillithiol biosynthesis deacetylase BshB1
VEIGLGGTLAKHAALGHTVGLCDLTRGELASNGTPDERLREAEEARRVLGAAWRENLALPDRAIGANPDHVRRVAELIRRCRPRAIALPFWHDRHPDHLAAANLLRDGVFNAKLLKYQAEGDPWQPESVCFYFINDSAPASFVVDVSDYYDVKRKALACYASQFQRATGTAETRLNSPGFNQLIESRDAQFGALAGVRYAEGIITAEPVVREHLLK